MNAAPFSETLTLLDVRRMMEGVVPLAMCTRSLDLIPHVNYLSLIEYVDPQHVALSYQFFNQSRQNVLATKRATVSLDDPYTGAGVVLQLAFVRSELSGPIFEKLRARLAGVAAHSGMEKVFHLKGADVFKVLELRRVPGRKELAAIAPRVDTGAKSRVLSERLASCDDHAALIDTFLQGLEDLLQIGHAMLWWLDPTRATMTLLSSRGYPTSGIGAEMPLGEGLSGTAAREAVPIRVGHMMNMGTYARAARGRAEQLGLATVLGDEIPLPGLSEPRSQLAVPLRARGKVLGVLFVESEHDQFFSYDDEDALTILCGQVALALTILDANAADPPAPEAAAAAPLPLGPPLRLRRYLRDNSIFIEDSYVIKGVAGAILWKLVHDQMSTGRSEFTNRELRLAPELSNAGLQDNLETRLVLLQRRLDEQGSPLRIEKTGRGRFRLTTSASFTLEQVDR
jgi:adenylate cyclase